MSPPSSRRVETFIAGVAVAALLAIALAFGLWRSIRRPAPPPPAAASVRVAPAIAVLPFRSFSGDPDYFVDGMTDGLIDSLARVGGLRVISRQSAMHFKGSTKLLAEVARELGVDYLVEGTITRRGERLEIRAKLLRPDPEEQLWSESYERSLEDFLAVEAQVATAIAGQLKVALTPSESARLASVGSVDAQAHDAFLRGKYQTNERSADSLTKAIDTLHEAIRIAPEFAPAHAALAEAYSYLARLRADARDLQIAGRKAAERALELDPASADALVARARLDLYADWRWSEAETGVRRALELDPSHAEAHLLLWNLELAHGRVPAAAAAIERAVELDPLSVAYNDYLGIQRFFERDNDAARAQLEKTLTLAPEYGPALMSLWGVEARVGRSQAAFDSFRRALPRLGYGDLVPTLDAAYAEGGFEAAMREAGRCFAAERNGRPRWIDAVPYTAVFAGDLGVAIDFLERAHELHSPTLIWIRSNPAWDPIRADPRFVSIVERMGLAD